MRFNPEIIRVCAACNEAVKGVQSSEDGDSLDFCSGCDTVVEGHTKEINLTEYEKLHG